MKIRITIKNDTKAVLFECDFELNNGIYLDDRDSYDTLYACGVTYKPKTRALFLPFEGYD